MKADLHVHTQLSDGCLSPLDTVELAAKQGITLLAITDHDTLEGADSLRHAALPLRLLPGVELSIRDREGLHLLGYGVGEGTSPLRRQMERLRQARVERGREILHRLTVLGYPLPDTLLKQRGTVGRGHIARAMVAHGMVANLQEAFDRFLQEGAAAYVPSAGRFSMAEALDVMHASRVVPVLAHPALLHVEDQNLEPLLAAWKEQGLQGVEVYHPAQKARGFHGLERKARRLGLLVTGGSDFHSLTPDQHSMLGAMTGAWKTQEQDVEALLQALEETDEK